MKRILFICSLILTGCGLFPEGVEYNDHRLTPLWDAVNVVTQRSSWGFSAIETNADIRLEGPSDNYDAMLHIYYKTSRTIAFRKNGSKYRWIGEQEIHTGPRKYKTVDGMLNEQIIVTYEVESISGHPLNKVNVSYYWAENENERYSNDLSLEAAQELITQWHNEAQHAPPEGRGEAPRP